MLGDHLSRSMPSMPMHITDDYNRVLREENERLKEVINELRDANASLKDQEDNERF